MTQQKILVISLILAVFGILTATALLINREPAPLEFTDLKGISIISPPVPLPQVHLVDYNGQRFDTGNFSGKWSLLFFGYTHCPDVCPTTLATLKAATSKITAPAPQAVFISLDPKRDTADKLRDYVSYFHPDFIGLNGDKTEIDTLSEALGIIYDYEGDTENDNYIVNHYAAILVVDPQARLRAHILPPHSADKVSKAFTSIRDYYGD